MTVPAHLFTRRLMCLAIMRSPFGFMAFLGIASLIGVIVSHVIVLFDFIEEMRDKGEPFEQAIRDAGIERGKKLSPIITESRLFANSSRSFANNFRNDALAGS